jgi:hypothetical protein
MNSNSGIGLDLQNKPLKIKIILFTILGLILILLYYIEKFIYFLVNLVFYYNILTIIVVISLHLLLIRTIVYWIIFPGSNFFVRRLMRFENGKIQANNFVRILSYFKSSVESLKSTSQKYLDSSSMRSIRGSERKIKNKKFILI